MERHKCKLCSRTFSTGRALGGHMKSHLASFPLPPQKTHKQLGDTTDSASSSSSSSGEKQELKDKSSEVAEEKSLAYGLRNNPKKSFRIADPEFSFAVDSESVVQDRESETESRNPTRRRSKRARKLFTPADQDQKQDQQNLEIKKQKLSNFLDAPTEPEPVSSVSDTSPEEDVAMCLMMLSRDVWTRNNDEKNQENCKERERLVEKVEESKEIKKIRGKHCCEKCRKVFRSSHALSGHKKVCEAETKNAGGKVCSDEKIFECSFCYRVFGSGQALGGHKRSHLLATSSTASAVAHSVSVKVENNLIDLNLPAPLEEDDYSVVSDA